MPWPSVISLSTASYTMQFPSGFGVDCDRENQIPLATVLARSEVAWWRIFSVKIETTKFITLALSKWI